MQKPRWPSNQNLLRYLFTSLRSPFRERAAAYQNLYSDLQFPQVGTSDYISVDSPFALKIPPVRP